MPRAKKKPLNMTTEEAMRKLFPKPVREEAKKTARESRKRNTKKDSNE
jgi:hypothetical protein